MSQLPEEFLSPYNPNESEDSIYKQWEDSGYFNPDQCVADGVCKSDAETFTMVLPPPNATGVLHLGHALESTMQDTVMRYNRMLGKRTLWIPGTDHAAIATDAKVTKILAKQGKRKHEIGREAFLEHVHEFVADSRSTIQRQLRKVGDSLDWSREAFTLDDERQQAVFTAFQKMYDAGLIYRGHRIVNWDPKGQTTISDDEIVRKEETTKFYYFQYGPFEIGTARPETKFADKYIVVHPDDERYAQYEHLQEFQVEWINGPITATLVKDPIADPEIGTGAMTITPWHSQVDFELAQKYDLPYEQIIDQYGKLLPVAGEFAGQKITVAREAIVEKLQAKGLVTKIEENYVHQLATAERTGATVEPQIMEQWFVDVNKPFTLATDEIDGFAKGQEISLKEAMMQVVKSGQIKVIPERFERVYYNWIGNLRDWCISRQIWYGHRIPVWYKDGETKVSLESPGEGWSQDEDTLDTWFSSGLWPFSTLGWPNQTDDYANYFPTQFMNPGYEILFFWVARMVLMSVFLVGKIPFETVYLHGMLRDEKGRKFSKSLGNGVDPIKVIENFGADALRMSLLVGIGPGADSRFDVQKVKAYKKFSNKIWNISRFVLENTLDMPESTEYTKAHQVHWDTFQAFIDEITTEMNEYKYYLVSEKLYHYVWNTFANEILEECKELIFNGSDAEKASAQTLLKSLLVDSLRLLHPFMPFVTERIWQLLPGGFIAEKRQFLMIERWPSTVDQG